LDHFLKEKNLWTDDQISNSSLAQKMNAVATYFENNAIMDKAQLVPIRKAATGQTILVSSIKSLHAFVHNKYYSPIPTEIKIAWDDTQLFMIKIWS
jgi:hypothetical protein